jgi:7-carboxy-7-deazaguanine synthase
MMNDELTEGKQLPLMEEFYTLQGEGYHTGKASYLIRLGGCDIGCYFCDTKESWNADMFREDDTDKIIERILSCPAKSVIVTGGEPLLYNLEYLCRKLKEFKIETCLETSGAHKLTGKWDWICLSPKRSNPPVDELYKKANELKIIISEEKDFSWAEQCAEKTNESCQLYLQPEWSRRVAITPIIIDYILKHPKWKISMQLHKYLGIP